jgi:hypothetical protein
MKGGHKRGSTSRIGVPRALFQARMAARGESGQVLEYRLDVTPMNGEPEDGVLQVSSHTTLSACELGTVLS